MSQKRYELALCAAAFSSLMITHILPNTSGKFLYTIIYILAYVLPVILVMLGNKSAEQRHAFIINPSKSFSLTSDGVYLCGIFFAAMLAVSIILNAIFQTPADFSELTLYTFIVSGILAPVLEEMLWRKTVFSSLAYSGTFQAMLISSLLFGMLHSTTAGMIYAVFAGMLFSYLYSRTGSLLPCILLHMANNISSLLTPIFPYTVYIFLAIGIISAVCAKLYQKNKCECAPKADFVPDTSAVLKSPFLYATFFIFIIVRAWR